MENESSEANTQLQLFVQHCLALVTMVAKSCSSNSMTSAAKFWRALLAKVYDVLDKINFLIPTPIFVEMIASLLGDQHLTVRKKSLELLSHKLQQLDAAKLTDKQVRSEAHWLAGTWTSSLTSRYVAKLTDKQVHG